MAHEKIVIVDNDPQALQVMATILRRADYIVICATDGVQGLEVAKQEQPDLILIDVQLPGMNGLAVARSLKEDPAAAAIPIVAVTAVELRGEEAEAMVRNCVGYIPKPVSPRSVIELVPTFLQAGKRRRGGA